MPQARIKKGKRTTKQESNALADMAKALGLDFKRMMTDPAYAQQLLKQYQPMMESMNTQDMQQMMQSIVPMMNQLKETMPMLKDLAEIMGEMNTTLGELDDEEDEEDDDSSVRKNDEEDDEEDDIEDDDSAA